MKWSTEMNALAKAEGASVVYGETKFSDMTPAEFSKSHGYAPRKDRVVEEDAVKPFDGSCPACDKPGLEEVRDNLFGKPNATKNALGLYVDSFDWTTKGAVTPVKDQAQCGSCWAFGTTGDMEGTNFIATGKLPSLSEQQLVSCDTKEDEGCNGGLQEDAFAYVIQKGGLVSEKDYPYTSGGGRTGTCKLPSDWKQEIAGTITKWSQISNSAKGETNIGPALQSSGPITIGIDASQMQNYVSGVDVPRSCNAQSVDHAVLIVGFGKDTAHPKKPYYWKIKNSWGKSWGEDGYYRIMAGVSACGLATDAVHSKY
eukprot:CAMPEP_0181178810 /NCGR_PEP_ID=MMETSP1096-20121128/5919_1 /TAXON_ID=156174 ORGANISM="Chrysochromulina ericina, Strain CCMP281" /NCGR_SAMPLE_ID=MMETSP1096 /ASSEMBLY_ACC=CAM_ASM_000453 /LENGTH=312 /DNA_ID=CAMNT_0023267105 /DNA_START=81 /DNA_END=1019 /DNA_ORIENTATION=-